MFQYKGLILPTYVPVLRISFDAKKQLFVFMEPDEITNKLVVQEIGFDIVELFWPTMREIIYGFEWHPDD